MTERSGPAVPVGGGVPLDPETGERFGYLPRKAAQRKIIIRRALGLPWVIGALAAALLIAVAGIAFFASRPDSPGKGFDDAGPLSAYPAGHVTPLLDRSGWVDRRSGLTVWLTTAAYCPADGGWVDGGRRWDRLGRPASDAGSEPLRELRTRAVRNRLYVDRTPDRPHFPAAAAPAPLAACREPQPIR
jgi:hypothetical protein